MSPEAKLSPPPTRSRISRSGRCVAWCSVPPAQATAPQSLRRRGADGAQRRGDDGEVRELRDDRVDHRREPADVEVGRGSSSDAGDLEAEGGGEVLLVADAGRRRARASRRLTSLGPGLPAERLPQARPVVEVVGHDGAVPAGGGHRRPRRRPGCVLRERGEDAAGVEPPHAVGARRAGPSRRRRGAAATAAV